MAQKETHGKPPQAPPTPHDSDLAGRFETQLTISSATVEESKAHLAASIKDAAKLDEGSTSSTPASHAIDVRFTAREANSLDVYDSFGDWLEGLARFVREQVAAARPRPAFPLSDNPRFVREQVAAARPRPAFPLSDNPRPAPPYARNITLTGHGSAPSGEAPLRSTQLDPQPPVVQPASRPGLQSSPAPADNARLSLWEDFRSPPPAQNAHESSSTPSTRDHILKACYDYNDSD